MFIQTIEFTATDRESVQQLAREWSNDATTDGSARWAHLGRETEAPDRYEWIVGFDSPEAAQANSDREKTAAYSDRLRALCREGPTFRDLQVVHQAP